MEKRFVITAIEVIGPGFENQHELIEVVRDTKTQLKNMNIEHFGEYLGGRCKELNEEEESLLNKNRMTLANYRLKKNLEGALKSANLTEDFFNNSSDLVIVSSSERDDPVLNYSAIKSTLQEKPQRTYPLNYIYDACGMSSCGFLTSLLKSDGPSYYVSGLCASTNLAIQQAINHMKADNIPVGLVASYSLGSRDIGVLWGFKLLRILNKNLNPEEFMGPLDEKRGGIALSEGSGVLIIEELEHALNRNAPILAEVVASSIHSDSGSPLRNSPEIIEKTTRNCLSKAGLNAQDIDWVNLHVTATYEGDLNEAVAMKNIFSETNTLFNTCKGHFGHSMAACGMFEIAANLQSFKDNIIHPCAALNNIDPRCDINGKILNQSYTSPKPLNYFLNFNAGLRGISSSTIFKRWNM